MKLTKREKILLIIMGVVALAVLYLFLVFLPLGREVKELKAEYTQKQNVISNAQRKDERIKEINSQLQKLDSELNAKKGRIAASVHVPDILDELYKQAEKNGVTLENIQFSGDAAAVKGEFKAQAQSQGTQGLNIPALDQLMGSQSTQQQQTQSTTQNSQQAQKAENTVRLRTLSMSFTITGKYNNVVSFFKYYETNSRLFVTDILDLRGKGDDLQGSVTIKTFTLSTDDGSLYNTGNNNSRTNPFK